MIVESKTWYSDGSDGLLVDSWLFPVLGNISRQTDDDFLHFRLRIFMKFKYDVVNANLEGV